MKEFDAFVSFYVNKDGFILRGRGGDVYFKRNSFLALRKAMGICENWSELPEQKGELSIVR